MNPEGRTAIRGEGACGRTRTPPFYSSFIDDELSRWFDAAGYIETITSPIEELLEVGGVV